MKDNKREIMKQINSEMQKLYAIFREEPMLPCGCPRLDENSMCINQEHVKLMKTT